MLEYIFYCHMSAMTFANTTPKGKQLPKIYRY